MPINIQDVESEVGAPGETDTGSQSALSPDDLRQLAELIYKLMKEDLRIERERLGR